MAQVYVYTMRLRYERRQSRRGIDRPGGGPRRRGVNTDFTGRQPPPAARRPPAGRLSTSELTHWNFGCLKNVSRLLDARSEWDYLAKSETTRTDAQCDAPHQPSSGGGRPHRDPVSRADTCCAGALNSRADRCDIALYLSLEAIERSIYESGLS
ncbi:hypothetical protein EVAR_37046_1 [Eumeta japonica]|uniref:Uncharacterized protein n=1 Tax=Eumeta variegata TaxID=151549 RepID=A0A4C1WFN4_EUMVA|nr:hypothetical protein EVAR_37046_1 [Eumeta japonica]